MTFDAYIRVSKEGGRTDAEIATLLAEYEGRCRSLARRYGIEVGEVVTETDVSGSAKVAERKLEGLILRVEAGESAGIIAPDLERFARDQIEMCLALDRIMKADGALLCDDGTDSRDPNQLPMMQVRTAFAQDYLRKTRDRFQSRIEAAVERGVWLYPVPFGYRLVEDRKLKPDAKAAKLVKALFARRAEGENVGSLLRWLKSEGYSGTVSGVRSILGNRCYLGEMTVQSKRKGEPRVIQNAHVAILTEDDWQAAQLKGVYAPRDGSIAAGMQLAGLVYCSGCERRCRGMKTGKNGAVSYVCTAPDCKARAGIAAGRLDGFVESILVDAVYAGEPNVIAVLQGDERYAVAQAALAAAVAAHAKYRDSVDIQTALGEKSFAEGLTVRAAAIETAREALGAARPTVLPITKNRPPRSLAEAEAQETSRYVSRVVLKSAGGPGRKVPVEDRVELWFVGATEPAQWERVPASEVPGGPKTSTALMLIVAEPVKWETPGVAEDVNVVVPPPKVPVAT